MKPLDEVIDWYQIASDSQRVVSRLLDAPSEFPRDSVFALKPLSEARRLLETAAGELDDLAVLSLASLFEKVLLDHLMLVAERTIRDHSVEPFARSVCEYAFEKADRWHFPDVLDLFKSIVGSGVVGDVKQVYEYRNWVAHGRRKLKPLALDPREAYQRLSEFLERAGL